MPVANQTSSRSGDLRDRDALRRRALCLAYLNSMLWSIGNGLTTGALVIYLAKDLGASGRQIGLLLAAPALVGVLRLFTPAIIGLFGTAKRTCLALSFFSYLLIWILPAVALEELVPRRTALPMLVTLLCAHQLLESTALAALWAWLADVVPRQVRGRYFARRQILQLLVLIPTILLSGFFADAWRDKYGKSDPEKMLLGYAIPNSVGAAALMASLVPLLAMSATLGRHRARRSAAQALNSTHVKNQRLAGQQWSSITAPWRDARFWPLLIFGCWLSFSNGLTQAVQNIYPKDVLALGVFALAVMRTMMQLGQMGYAAWVGPLSDRFGNRPVLIVSQIFLALAPLFFLSASPEHPWIVAGAWVMWSAYAGLNICLPNLSLKLGGNANAASYIATYFGVTSVFYAASTVIGGYLFDELKNDSSIPWVAQLGGRFAFFFWIAWLLRSTAVFWLLAIPEPGARTWREILFRRKREEAANVNV